MALVQYSMANRENAHILEVSLTIGYSDNGGMELLTGMLNCQGIPRQEIAESLEWPYRRLSVYFTSGTKAKKFQDSLRALRLKHVRCTVNRLRDKDWKTKWKDDFKPFVLTRTFGVVPIWQKGTYQFRGKVPIYIDTDLAFGTGLHPTTKYVAGFIERLRGRFNSFFDFGTGTGILSILASKCGCPDVEAIDISADAVTAARKNFISNDCPQVKVKTADGRKWNIPKKYDLVCANILTQDLIEMGDIILRTVNPGRYLAVSGISLISYKHFRAAFARYGLRCIKVEKGKGWAAILYQKPYK